jgi:hypothetical protein
VPYRGIAHADAGRREADELAIEPRQRHLFLIAPLPLCGALPGELGRLDEIENLDIAVSDATVPRLGPPA